MQKLVTGIHQFQRGVFASQKELFARLADGQNPLALFITCSDSRIDPTLLTQTEPGELFILRVAGNIVPAHGAPIGGEAATIEYAVSVLNVRDIIICGHSRCGAMAAVVNDHGLEKLPAVRKYLRHADATKRIIEDNYTHVTDPQKLTMLAIEENVLVQLENLRTHPCVSSAMARGDLNLHGWVYKFETGQVFSYSGEQQQYIPLDVQHAPVYETNGQREILAI